jgi:hypothetical protein
MKTHVLRGAKQEIAESLLRLSGDIREAIVFVEEPAPAPGGTATIDAVDIFEEMQAFMVDGHEVDDSREAIYTRLDGE